MRIRRKEKGLGNVSTVLGIWHIFMVEVMSGSAAAEGGGVGSVIRSVDKLEPFLVPVATGENVAESPRIGVAGREPRPQVALDVIEAQHLTDSQ